MLNEVLKFLIYLFLLTIFSYNKVNGENCGGILEGDAGEVSIEAVEPGSTCVWVIKLLVNPTLLFYLNDISEGTVLNLYPEHDPSQTFLEPITLSNSNINSTIETKGQTLVLILVQHVGSSDSISFSWDSFTYDSPPFYLSSSANYAENTQGKTAWTKFNQRHSLLWTLNLPSTKKVNLEANIQFETCDLLNPCQCSSFGAYEVLSNGFLREMYRVCGHSFSFEEIDLPPKILTFVYINSTIPMEQSRPFYVTESLDSTNANSNRIEIKWSSRDDTETTTTTITQESTTEAASKSFVCPPENQVIPCNCTDDYDGQLSCKGATVTESDVYVAWAAVRYANNLTLPDQWLTIGTFELSETEIPKLDISLFFYTRFLGTLEIIENNQLVSLLNGQSSRDIRTNADLLISETKNDGLIDASRVSIYSNDILSNEGIEDFFPYFIPTITYLNIAYNNVTGGSYPIGDAIGEFEWLPGLSRFIHLEEVYVNLWPPGGEYPLLFSGAPFKRNRNLRVLAGEFGYQAYVKLGENAFALDPPDVDFGEGEFFRIDFTWSRDLDDSTFNSTEGAVLGGMNRPTNLVLMENNFTFLSQSNFQHFLDEHVSNRLEMAYNQFVCDHRMKWLKDGRDSYEHRVSGVDCTNDPGETVFTTNLIS